MKINIYVVIYLIAIVSANLIVNYFGPSAAIYCEFLFIGLDLSLRDHIHDKWQGDFSKLWGLISAGSLITIAINIEAIEIAIASAVAFSAAFAADSLLYQLLRKHNYLFKCNISNVAGSAADSFIFPIMAFGYFPGIHWIILGQFAAKILGGLIFSFIIYKWIKQRTGS